MQKDLTIIIPTLTNVTGLLSELKELNDYPVIVVDNAVTKEKSLACKKHPHCTYLPQATNLGFARAINFAFPHLKTEWFCILNDDIEFAGTLPFPQLLDYAKANNFEAVSPCLIDKKGQVENLGYQVLPIGKVKLIFPPINHQPSTINHQLDGLTAACLVMKSSVFRALHGFDGRFFAYLEDVDLFLRLKKAKHKFGVAKNLKVVHNHMTTSSKMNNFKAKMDLKNWLFVIAKNWSFHELVVYFPGIVLERLRNLSGFAKATWKSYGWRSLYFFPYHLLWIIKELFIFPFRSSSTLDKLS